MTRSIQLTVLFFLTLFICAAVFYGKTCTAAEGQKDPTQSTESVEQMMAGLSDEQVRQLLIDELKNAAETDELLSPREMKGPAFVLSRMLTRLSRGQDDNKSEIATLFSFIPSMGPDLYKTFVKL